MNALKKIIPATMVAVMALSGHALADRGGPSGGDTGGGPGASDGQGGCGGCGGGGGTPSEPSSPSSSNEGGGEGPSRQFCHYTAYYNKDGHSYSGYVYINSHKAAPITFTFEHAAKVPATLGKRFYEVEDVNECKSKSGKDGVRRLKKIGAQGPAFK